GSLFSGTINAEKGHLVVDGDFSRSAVAVSPTSQLSGTGTIGALFNGGLFTPGTADTIGTMTIEDIFFHVSNGVSDATLGININADAAIPVAGVNNDLVVVNGPGGGVLLMDGKLDVVAESGDYTDGMRFDFL